jgi:hypothetical protein
LSLVLTIVPKALPRFQISQGPPPAEARAEVRTLAFLAQHGYEVHSKQGRSGALIYATSGECQLRVIEVDPNGSQQDRERLIAAQADRTAFVFDGKVYPDQPMIRTALSYSWTRLQNRIGVPAQRKIVLGIAASQGCSLEKLPWSEIADQHLVSGPA